MKYLLLILVSMLSLASCGGENSTTQKADVSPELVEEIKKMEAETEELETTIEEIESSSEELDQLLEEL